MRGCHRRWAAVYLRDGLHAAPAVAGLGYAAFALAMVVFRLVGGRLLALAGRRRLLAGRRRLLSGLAAPATAGMAGGLASGVPAVAIAGFTLLGAGLATIIPVLFSAAGEQPGIAPGTAVATVATIGWAGFVCGPPLIGFVSDRSSLAVALGVLPLLTAFVAVACARTPALERSGGTADRSATPETVPPARS